MRSRAATKFLFALLLPALALAPATPVGPSDAVQVMFNVSEDGVDPAGDCVVTIIAVELQGTTVVERTPTRTPQRPPEATLAAALGKVGDLGGRGEFMRGSLLPVEDATPKAPHANPTKPLIPF